MDELNRFILDFENELFDGVFPEKAFIKLKLRYYDRLPIDFDHPFIQKKINEFIDYLKIQFGTDLENTAHLAESNATKNHFYLHYQSVLKTSRLLKINDPTVVKMGLSEEPLNETCKMLWHNPFNVLIPRPYKLSQLIKGAMTDFRNPYPSTGPTHINCQHQLILVTPGFSFNEKGHPIYIGQGFDYYSYYYNLKPDLANLSK